MDIMNLNSLETVSWEYWLSCTNPLAPMFAVNLKLRLTKFTQANNLLKAFNILALFSSKFNFNKEVLTIS